MNTFEKARKFIYRNARPVDLALFKYCFENGSRDDVLTALAAYQNPDGGFGWGIEADNFNRNSLPMGVWKATEYIRSIGGIENDHPLISGILRYLESSDSFDEAHRQWQNTVPSNNDCPCAFWWKYTENGSLFEYNPTAALAGFIVKYAQEGSALYKKGLQLVKEAADWFINDAPIERHIARCFITMYDDCKDAGIMPFDETAFLSKLDEIVDKSICRDVSHWGDYIPRPSAFITSKNSRFYSESLENLCKAECEYIKNTQLDDGSFNVPWQWSNYNEWYVAENWCKTAITIDNMLFLREFDPLYLTEE